MVGLGQREGWLGRGKGDRVSGKFVTWSNDRQRSGVSPFNKWHLRQGDVSRSCSKTLNTIQVQCFLRADFNLEGNIRLKQISWLNVSFKMLK